VRTKHGARYTVERSGNPQEPITSSTRRVTLQIVLDRTSSSALRLQPEPDRGDRDGSGLQLALFDRMVENDMRPVSRDQEDRARARLEGAELTATENAIAGSWTRRPSYQPSSSASRRSSSRRTTPHGSIRLTAQAARDGERRLLERIEGDAAKFSSEADTFASTWCGA